MAINRSDNFNLSAPKLLDARSGPFSSMSTALGFINTAFRTTALPVYITIDGNLIEHWFRDGTDDNQLIPKSFSTSNTNLTYLANVDQVFNADIGTDLANINLSDLVTDVNQDIADNLIEEEDIDTGWRILIVESTTGSEEGKIAVIDTINTGADTFTFSYEDGGAGNNGTIGDTVAVQYGALRNKRFNYTSTDGWVFEEPAASSLPPQTIDVAYLLSFTNGLGWAKNHLISVKEYYVDITAFNSGFTQTPGASAIIGNTGDLKFSLDDGTITGTIFTKNINTDDLVAFCLDRLAFFSYDGAIIEQPLGGEVILPIDVVFDDDSTSLPATTATTIDGETVVEGTSVLVKDSATAGQINKVYDAAVASGNITWTVRPDLGANNGSAYTFIFIEKGQSGNRAAQYKNLIYMYNGTEWQDTLANRIPLNTSSDAFRVLTAGTGEYLWMKGLVTVHRAYADSATMNGDVGTWDSDYDSAVTLDTGVIRVQDGLGAAAGQISNIVYGTANGTVVFVASTGTFYYKWNDTFEELSLTSTFSSLSDTPSNYTGQSLKVLRVNFGESGIEYVELTKALIDLGEVDNTADADKPISDDTQTALNLKADANDLIDTNNALDSHVLDTINPHSVTKAQVGLGSADNTADADKPISTDTQTALDTKASVRDDDSTFTDISGTETITLSTDTRLPNEDQYYTVTDDIEFTIAGTRTHELNIWIKTDSNNALIEFTNVVWDNGTGYIFDTSGETIHLIKIKYINSTYRAYPHLGEI